MSTTELPARPVGRMVELLAKVRKVSKAELATHIGVHRNTFSKKLAGDQPFYEDEIVKLAAKLRVTPGRLFENPEDIFGPSGVPGSAWNRRTPALRILPQRPRPGQVAA